jgi:hypothetical protein
MGGVPATMDRVCSLDTSVIPIAGRSYLNLIAGASAKCQCPPPRTILGGRNCAFIRQKCSEGWAVSAV